jgi:hypothetical protein
MTMEEIEKECKHYGINSPFILEYTNKTICAILEKPAEKNVSSLDLERVVIPLTTLIGGGGILYLISSEIRRRKKRTEDTGNPLDL